MPSFAVCSLLDTVLLADQYLSGGCPDATAAANQSFGLAVHLRVVSRGQAGRRSDEPAELPPKPGHELGPPVRDDVLGEPVDW